ncbi:unnamed protein product [Pocillopora meandrina]|uniref:Transposase Helix-turn-helix domain-containing protein n=1 Tax=Pocillopora meandrina TaxID=46732 RepID=A0AAU9WTA5_9CNID|nr:unnamed protein product [Pocillopora meandrina]
MIPNSEVKKTLGFAVHISRLPPSKIPLAGEEKLFQVNCRSILIPQQTRVLFLLVKKDWMIGRNEHLMSNVLNLKRVGRLQRKAKIPGSQQATRQFFLDHNYCQRLLNNDKGTQTDFSFEDLQALNSEINTLKEENANLKAKLTNSKQLKRELFVDDVLKDDESVKFYTGIPSLACLTMIFNLLKPFAEKLKYWDKNKEKEVTYQKDSSKKKPGKQRLLTIMEEFILTLVRLRLGLLSRHLSDIFGVSEGTVSKVFTTWKAVKSTSAIPSVRIYVERAIGRLKDFRILQGNFLVPMLPIADNIFSVCAALCNLLPPLAK